MNQTVVAVCLLLATAVTVLYWPITGHGFIYYDDPRYIFENSHVSSGLTWDGLRWSFQCGYASNWHPLTWISHMVGCTLFGLDPAGHHFMNLLFHAGNTVLLFLLLTTTTGSLWRSAFVAALFACHPLHVESVAWASERKDVLSVFFGLLTLIAYVRYARGSRGSKVESRGTDPGGGLSVEGGKKTLTPSLSHRMGEGARRAGEGPGVGMGEGWGEGFVEYAQTAGSILHFLPPE